MKRMYKSALALLLATSLAGGTAYAQNQSDGLNFAEMRDGVVMTDGTLMLVRNGQATPLQEETRLPNGFVVSTDGTVVMSNGERQQLRDGKALNERGKIVSARHDMLSYEAILRHEYARLGDKASPLAVRLGQGDQQAQQMVRMRTFYAPDGSILTLNEAQTRQMEQQARANETYMRAMEEQMSLLDQLLDLTNERLSLMEGSMSAHRRISLPEELARIDQGLNQVEARLNDLENIDFEAAYLQQNRSFGQQGMSRQGGYAADGRPNTYQTDVYDLAQGQKSYELLEQQTSAMQRQLEAVEEKFALLDELLDLTGERLNQMESSMDGHRRISLPLGVNQLDEQIQHVDQELKAVENRATPIGEGSTDNHQNHTMPLHNQEALPQDE